jgi:outer membrane protein assembly factor BamB
LRTIDQSGSVRAMFGPRSSVTLIAACCCVVAVLTSTARFAAAAPANVNTWHNDDARTGLNPNEIVLTPANVNSTNFGKLFVIPTDGRVTAQVLYRSALSIPGKGFHNVVFIATEHDSVYACDADDGTVLWHATLLKAGETPSDNTGCNIMPEVGITSTPVIGNGVIYVQGMSKDSTGAYHQRLHALNLATGAEMPGSPVENTATFAGTGDEPVFNPRQHFDRAGLVLSKGVIYTTWTAFCDRPPYSGWIMGYNTSLQQVSVLSITPNGGYGSIWQSGAAPAVDGNGHLFLMTANGTFDTTFDPNGFPLQRDFGNAFLQLGPAAARGLDVVDYFAPYNTVDMSSTDHDLGSGGTMLLPDMADAAGHTRHLALGAGKDGHIYIADRDNMGKFNPNSNANLYQDVDATALRSQCFSSPAFFGTHLYYAVWTQPLRQFEFVDARLNPVPSAVSSNTFGYPGTTPSISANGTASGIVWVADTGNPNAEGTDPAAIATLRAYDATNVGKELYNSNQAANARDQFGHGNNFVVPTIANGKAYVGTQNTVGVFGLFDPPRLANISTRAAVGVGDNALIAGFIIQGSAPRKMIIRGIGPSLRSGNSALAGTLQDPMLELYDGTGHLITNNDNWQASPQQAEISGSGVAPNDSHEAAILQTLNPGTYSAILRGTNSSTGIGLVDFYDVSEKPNSTLANISSRGFVGTGDNVLIGGVIVLGVAPQKVVVRAIGPDLTDVHGALANPVLELHDSDGAVLATNDNWRSDQEAEISASGLAPANDLDAAIVRTLPAAKYTAIVRGSGSSTGVALVEAYALR